MGTTPLLIKTINTTFVMGFVHSHQMTIKVSHPKLILLKININRHEITTFTPRRKMNIIKCKCAVFRIIGDKKLNKFVLLDVCCMYFGLLQKWVYLIKWFLV